MDIMIRNGLLYQIYGFSLTKTQQELCEAYFYYDLSLSEIAENRQISKQAVSDQLKRCLEKMEFMEDHLHVLADRIRAKGDFEEGYTDV